MLQIQLSIAIFTLIWAFIVVRMGKGFGKNIKDFTNGDLFLLPIFAIVLFLTVFRGQETGVDYITYASINNILAENTWTSMWSVSYIDMEPLLLILIKALSFLQMGLVPFLFVTTMTVLTVYYKAVRAHSKIVWLSVFLLFCFASYFTIFNTTSQMFVCMMAFAASAYIYRGNFWKYVFAILVVSLFHKTAFIMIPMYFLLRYDSRKHRLARSIGLVGVVCAAIIFISLGAIVSLGVTTVFPEYTGKVAELPEVSPLVAIRPLLILVFVWVYRKYLNLSDTKERVWFNSLFYIAIMTIFSIKFGLIQRFTYFLLPYTVLIVPLVVSRLPIRKKRWAIILLILIGLSYIALTGSVSEGAQYSFIWESTI